MAQQNPTLTLSDQWWKLATLSGNKKMQQGDYNGALLDYQRAFRIAENTLRLIKKPCCHQSINIPLHIMYTTSCHNLSSAFYEIENNLDAQYYVESAFIFMSSLSINRDDNEQLPHCISNAYQQCFSSLVATLKENGFNNRQIDKHIDTLLSVTGIKSC